MVQYKLHYFDGRGLAEANRLLFHYVGQPFEDVRIAGFEEFQKVKQNFFYEKVPVLEVDGKPLAQSTTILRYLGEKFGLAGKDEWERAKANEIIDFHKDVVAELAPYIYAKMGYREGNVPQLRTDVFVPGLARLAPLYEKLLAASGSGFLLASGVSMVDFLVADYVLTLRKEEPEAIGAHQALVEHSKRVLALPQLQKYVSTRKE